MGIKEKLQLKWHRFLIKQKSKMEQILEDKLPELPPNYPAHPLVLNEYYFDYDPDEQLLITKKIMRQRLENLKININKTVQHNNGKLTFEQIHELEYIKATLNFCNSISNTKK